MRAFLSHSSLDKAFVEQASKELRPGTYELDSETFEKGVLNSKAILAALNRCSVFCLFLSENSVASTFVDFETKIAFELVAAGKINRLLVLCLDEHAFQQAKAHIKFYNVIRRVHSATAAGRSILGAMIASEDERRGSRHPFIGREKELKLIEEQVLSFERAEPRAIFLSGIHGSGRKSLVRKFFQNQFPQVSPAFARLDVHEYMGYIDLYQRLILELGLVDRLADLHKRIETFEKLSSEEKAREIAERIGSLSADNQALLLVDDGGLLSDSGALQTEINEIVKNLPSRPYPSTIMISPRMIPMHRRRPEDDIAYVAVTQLDPDDARRLLTRLLRERNIETKTESIDLAIELSEGHPFNIYRIAELIGERGVSEFLANPRSFNDWKHREYATYLSNVNLNPIDKRILAIFRIVPEWDWELISLTLDTPAGELSESIERLRDLHLLSVSEGRYTVAASLRVAVERDPRLQIDEIERVDLARRLSSGFKIRFEEGTAPFTLLDGAILAEFESGTVSPFFAAYVLPSHQVWLAKRHYDRRKWADCIKSAREAIKGKDRLSREGLLAAYRHICLASSRIGDDETFSKYILELDRRATDEYLKSNVAFLRGFNLRLKGELPDALDELQRAYSLNLKNSACVRELAAVLLAMGRLDEAEKFAREAYKLANTNSFMIDILASVLIRKLGARANSDIEVGGLLEKLQRVDDEDGDKSFFLVRKAELELHSGRGEVALRHIQEAIKRTPSLFEPKRLHAQILLKLGNSSAAYDVIQDVRRLVMRRDTSDRNTHYRTYLELEAEYSAATGDYKKASELVQAGRYFLPAESEQLISRFERERTWSATKR